MNKSLEQLKKKFETHDIERRYTAIVEGRLTSQKGCWKSYLHENANYVVKVVKDSDEGELAITHYQVKASNKAYSQLELTLETGKKNQIRVHCQHAGHPVVGDKKYRLKMQPIETTWITCPLFGIFPSDNRQGHVFFVSSTFIICNNWTIMHTS